MKRDFELIRKILLVVEATPAGTTPIEVDSVEGYDEATVLGHVDLLIDAGLLEGRVLRSNEGIIGVAIRKITWDGCNFLDAARDNGLWKKAFSTVKEKGGAMTFDVLTEMLKRLAQSAAGLS
ncbi:DUF2513 domain-containing protein [Ferriphaselus sp. R-1]|uniref:DUF2513 domain-containing protein n=1 Tax=Ferriphaselus sp. R-1 TaxID=1485544 RepID=UPI00055957EF|nr:DUF2513 domain-containing protein [Ferriphaselus sp. R-1]